MNERLEPLNDSPRHDHYGRRDNCSIDCPAHPEHRIEPLNDSRVVIEGIEQDGSLDDVMARLAAMAREMHALGIGVTLDVRIRIEVPRR